MDSHASTSSRYCFVASLSLFFQSKDTSRKQRRTGRRKEMKREMKGRNESSWLTTKKRLCFFIFLPFYSSLQLESWQIAKDLLQTFFPDEWLKIHNEWLWLLREVNTSPDLHAFVTHEPLGSCLDHRSCFLQTWFLSHKHEKTEGIKISSQFGDEITMTAKLNRWITSSSLWKTRWDNDVYRKNLCYRPNKWLNQIYFCCDAERERMTIGTRNAVDEMAGDEVINTRSS